MIQDEPDTDEDGDETYGIWDIQIDSDVEWSDEQIKEFIAKINADQEDT